MDESILTDEQLLFERGGDFDEPTFLRVLGEAIGALDAENIPFVLMGGIASTAMGRPRFTHDIDAFIRPTDGTAALDALDRRGFATQQTYPDWLFKGLKDGVLVDLIFRSKGDIYLDDEMLERARIEEFLGQKIPVISPEDLVVIKALVHDEHMPRHWHDALAIIGDVELDWDYLLRRGQRGARRVLSLLVYAQSNDLIVPASVISQLYDKIYET